MTALENLKKYNATILLLLKSVTVIDMLLWQYAATDVGITDIFIFR